jgi:hypothetical protein
VADLFEAAFRYRWKLVRFGKDLRSLHGSAQRTAIHGCDLFRLQPFGEASRLLTSVLRELYADGT